MRQDKQKKNKMLPLGMAVVGIALVGLLLWKMGDPPANDQQPTQTATQPTQATQAEMTEPEFVIETIPEIIAPEAGSLSYEEYLALDVDTQQAYYNNFDTSDGFFLWLDEAQAAYEATQEATTDQDNDIGIFIEEGVEDWE